MTPRLSQILMRLLGLAVLAFAACTQSGNGGGGKDDAVSTIKKTHEIKIAVNPYNLPFEYGKGVGVQGIGADVGEAIAKDLVAKVDPQARLNWAKTETFIQVFSLLDKGEAQLAISSISVTEDRKKKGYLFSQPYYPDSGQIIVTRKDDKKINQLSDLAGKKVGVEEHSTGQQFLEDQKLAGIQIQKFKTLDDALLKLSSGELEGVVGDQPIVSFIIFQTYRHQLQTVGDLLTQEPYAVMTKSPALRKRINETVARLDREGKLKEFAETRFRDMKAAQLREQQEREKPAQAIQTPKTVTFRISSSSFPIHRLDGHQVHLQGSGGTFTSSHIRTSGRSGHGSVGNVPPGKYHVTLGLLHFSTNLDVPATVSRRVVCNINFGSGGARVTVTP